MIQERRRVNRNDPLWVVFPVSGSWSYEDMNVITSEEKIVQELACLCSVQYISADSGGNATAFLSKEDGEKILEVYHELYT